MSNLSPLKPDNIILRQIAKSVDLKELKKPALQREIDRLLNFVYGTSNKGVSRDKSIPSTVGLSANQVGMKLRIAVVDLGIGHKSYTDLHVLVNPEIVWASKSIIEKDEGCVNLNNVRGFVKRSKRVIVKAIDRSGNKLTLDLKGWPAVLLQHEIDHLNGRLFIDRLDDPKHAHLVKKGELIDYKKLKKNWQNFIDVSKLAKSI